MACVLQNAVLYCFGLVSIKLMYCPNRLMLQNPPNIEYCATQQLQLCCLMQRFYVYVL